MRIQGAAVAGLMLSVSIVLSACTTTEDANNAARSRWLGQPVEAFCTAYGPPIGE